MKLTRLLLTVCALVVGVGLTAPDAEAKRLGGGKSVGTQSSTTTARTADTPTAPTAAAAAQPRKNSWMGPVAGLAAGLGLAALASHLGFGEELANMMLIGLLIVAALVVVRLIMRKRQPQAPMQYAGMGAGGGSIPMPAQPQPQASFGGGAAPAPVSNALPAGFDAEGFVRQAKVNFIRLQAANDAGNLADLREFVTPEMFAELQMDIRERGAAPQQTEVMELNAEVIECVEEGQRYRVGVRFHGLIREEAGAAPIDFNEIWHLTKPLDGSRGWSIAGIQQLN